MRISTNATFADVAAAFTAHGGPDRSDPYRIGWGSTDDDAAEIGRFFGVPTPAPIGVVQQRTVTEPAAALPPHASNASADGAALVRQGATTVTVPEALTARCYWFEKNVQAQKAQGPGAPAVYKLAAADVLLNAVDGTSDLGLLVTSWNANDVRGRILPALQEALRGVDDGSIITASTSDLDLQTPDVFRWLLNRMVTGLPISSTLRLDTIDALWVRDPLGQTAVLSDGLTADRLDLLTHLADDGKTYGPAKISVYSTVLQGSFTFLLHLDGRFQIDASASSYFDGVKRSGLQERTAQVEDVAHVIVPEIRAAYAADRTWKDVREQFRVGNTTEAIRKLEALRVMVPPAAP